MKCSLCGVRKALGIMSWCPASLLSHDWVADPPPAPEPPTLDEALRAYGLAMRAETGAEAWLASMKADLAKADDRYHAAYAALAVARELTEAAQKGVQEAAARAIEPGAVTDADNLEARR